jgi:hypothetical protein
MFNGEPLQLKVKGQKLRVDGELRICDIRLEAEITDDVAGGLPNGHAIYQSLESGALKRTVLDTGALDFELVMSSPSRDANGKGKPDIFKAKNVRVLEVPLARKDSEEGGSAEIVARPLVSLLVSDELMLYLAHHFADSDLTFKLTKSQTGLPFEGDAAKGNGKKQKPAES